MKEQKTWVIVASFIGGITVVLGIAFALFWFDPFKINGTDFGNEVITEREEFEAEVNETSEERETQVEVEDALAID